MNIYTSSSQQSIQKVVGFAAKHFPSCGEDIWDCIVEHMENGSINSRINVLYFLDSLCETSLMVKAQSKSGKSREINANGLYLFFISRDLKKIIDLIVPEGRQGLPNLISTKQILENWRSKRYIDPQKVDETLLSLDSRPIPENGNKPSPALRHKHITLPLDEVHKRIEQDRERHKRLRERRWVQRISHINNLAAPTPQLASFNSLTEAMGGQEELAMDIEFENEWETTSDWNEDDDEAIGEEAQLAFPNDDGRLRDEPYDARAMAHQRIR